MKKSERLEAVGILTTLLQQRLPLSHLFQTRPNLSSLSKEICFGTTRHYIRLETIADKLLHKRPKDIDVWLCIIIGLYQLHFLNIPDYAVVKETVALLEQLQKNWAKGLVNAILRRYCREKDALLTELKQNIHYHHDHPDWLIKRVQHDWPNDWQAILAANDEHPPMALRVNQKQISASNYLKQLQAQGIQGTLSPLTPTGIVLDKACPVTELPGFTDGLVSIQDLAAQWAVPLLDLKPGLRLLDACCAPGGKTCHALEAEPNLAMCVALDLDPKRLLRVQENLTRLKLNASLLQGNALQPDDWWDGEPFDRILLDAPCSATGVIRRHPDIKLLRTPSEISTASQLQKNLLEALWPLLAPGGRFVYATCSIMPEENEKQIEQFVSLHSDCQIIAPPLPCGHPTDHGCQILPGEHQMDGFFYGVLVKTC